jgi:SAM-dependent methyltransferase
MSRPAPIPSELYTDEYFRAQLRWGPAFLETDGRLLPPKGYVILALAQFGSEQRVLDVGCGRGELTMHAAFAGAESHGIDYATAGLRIARRLCDDLPADEQRRLHFYRSDAKVLPFADQSFDCIVTTELTEHLHPWELDECYRECARVLRPDGHIVVHTVPNRLRYTVYYPIRTAFRRVLRMPLELPDKDPLEEPLHVNEHTPLYMWRSLNRCFHARVYARSPRHFFAHRLSDRLRRLNPVAAIRCKNLWAIGVPRGPGARARLRALLHRVHEPPRALRMGTTELPHLGRGWSPPVYAPPVVRFVRGAADVRMAGDARARAIELGYRWAGPAEPDPVEIRLGRALLGREEAEAEAGTLRFTLPPGRLPEARLTLVLRAPPALGVHTLRVVGA